MSSPEWKSSQNHQQTSDRERSPSRAVIDKGVEEGAKLSLDGRDIKVDGFEEGSFVGLEKLTRRLSVPWKPFA